jgi:hypothetical protein
MFVKGIILVRFCRYPEVTYHKKTMGSDYPDGEFWEGGQSLDRIPLLESIVYDFCYGMLRRTLVQDSPYRAGPAE